MTEISLFDDLIDEPQNNCAANPNEALEAVQKRQKSKKKKQDNKVTAPAEPPKSTEERRVEKWLSEKIPGRIWVKMYSEWHLFEKTEGEASLEDVRRWMVGMGYTELSPSRAYLEVVDPAKSLEPQKAEKPPTSDTGENAEPANEEQSSETEPVLEAEPVLNEDSGQPGEKPYVLCSVAAKTFG